MDVPRPTTHPVSRRGRGVTVEASSHSQDAARRETA